MKWQSNQAPKFLMGSVLGEMMDSPIVRVALLVFCCNGGVLIGIIVWIECQIDTGIIGVSVRCWQVLANDIKKLTGVKGEQHWAETGALSHTKLQIKTV